MNSSSDKGKWAVLSSTFTLFACFTVTYLFYQYMIASFARGLGLYAKFTFNEVYLPWDPSLWNVSTVTEVNLYPHLICFFIGLVIFLKMKKQSESWGRYQIVAFWMMVCLINIPMSQLLYSPFGVLDIYSVFYYGLARVAVWYHIPFALQLIMAILALIAIIFWGYFLCKQVLKLSHSFSRIEKRAGKNNLIIRLYFLPLLLVFLPILALGDDLLTIRLAVMLAGLMFPIIGMFIRNSMANYQVNFKKSGTGDTFPAVALVMAISLWLLVYIRLS